MEHTINVRNTVEKTRKNECQDKLLMSITEDFGCTSHQNVQTYNASHLQATETSRKLKCSQQGYVAMTSTKDKNPSFLLNLVQQQVWHLQLSHVPCLTFYY